MRRSIFPIAALTILAFTACSPAQVVVTAQIEVDDPSQEGETRTLILPNVVVELVPFDRDVVFDSLEAAATTPEPEVPLELQEAQAAILEAQQNWQNLENRWNVLRDTLTKLNDELARYNPAEPAYIRLFNEWTDFDQQYRRIENQVESAFNRYDELERASIDQLQAIRIQQDNWANDAFADVDVVFGARMAAAGREVLTDTTTADGIAHFEKVKTGGWWVHARYDLPTTVLYWNFPIEVPGGETVQVVLDRAKAEERARF